MKQRLAYACALAMLPAVASADTFLGIYAGAYQWQQEFSGHVQSGNDELNFDNDLGFDDENGNVFYAAFEHPIPLLPNIRVSQTDLDVSANSSLSRNISFNGVAFPAATTLATEADLSHTDATLYYELLDNWISLDLGLTARWFQDGQVTLRNVGNGTEARETFDGVIPMLYVAARFDLPLSGLYAAASVNGLAIGGDGIMDYEAKIGYETSLGLGAELGLRSLELEIDDGSFESDLTIDGLFAGVFYHF